MGHDEELISFGDLDLIFKVTVELELPILSLKVLVCTISHELVGRFQPDQNLKMTSHYLRTYHPPPPTTTTSEIPHGHRKKKTLRCSGICLRTACKLNNYPHLLDQKLSTLISSKALSKCLRNSVKYLQQSALTKSKYNLQCFNLKFKFKN